jgi:hypothetical protein
VVAWRSREGVLDIEVPCAGTVAWCGTDERTLAFVEDQLRVTRKLMGFDSWSYCVAENEHVVERFVARHDAEGCPVAGRKRVSYFIRRASNGTSVLCCRRASRGGTARIELASPRKALSTSRRRCVTMLKGVDAGGSFSSRDGRAMLCMSLEAQPSGRGFPS